MIPPVWDGQRWLVRPGDGRTYVVAELPDDRAEKVKTSTMPPAIAWAVLLAPLIIGLVAAAAAVLQPSKVLILIVAGALLSSVVAAVAASMLFDTALRRRELESIPWAPGAPQRSTGAPVRHLQSVASPQAAALSRSRPALGSGRRPKS